MGDKESEKKGFDIASLIPEKIAVETSAGTLYVRHRWSYDLGEIDSLEGVGGGPAQAIVRLYASKVQGKSEAAHLAQEDFLALSEEDIKNLLLAVGKHGDMKDFPGDVGAERLGALIKDDIRKQENKLRKSFDDITKKYDFLGTGVSSAFHDQAVKAAEMLRMTGGFKATELSSYKTLQQFADSELQSTPIAAAQTYLDQSFNGRLAAIAAARDTLHRGVEEPFVAKRHLAFKLPENPLLEPVRDSAQSSRETAQKIDSLIGVVGGLHNVVIDKFLPAWTEQVQSSEKKTEEALGISREAVEVSIKGVAASIAANNVAAKGLFWTRFTVAVSVVVFVSGLAWQEWRDRAASSSALEKLRSAEASFETGLNEQQKLINEQTSEIERLKGIVETQPTATDKEPAS